jgi:hypothetical protein
MIVKSFEVHNDYNVYNIGSGVETSLNQIIDELRRIFQSKKIKVTHHEAPKTFLSKTQVNTDRYINEFGQSSFTDLHDGLDRTVEIQ